MGYYTYRLFKSVSVDRLRRKIEDNIALYGRGTTGKDIKLTLWGGRGCSALLFTKSWEGLVLAPVAYQFGCVWMDACNMDGDSMAFTVNEGAEHRCGHDVNPWASEPKVNYNQEHIDYRIDRICELWPDQAATIRRYLLPWREPVRKLGRTRFLERKGKAYDNDEHEYGDSDQLHDFVRGCGINLKKYVTIGYPD